MKLIATCESCGEPIGSSGEQPQGAGKALLCAKCRASKLVDDEDDADFGGADSGSEPAAAPPPPRLVSDVPLSDPDVPDNYEILEVLSECQHGKGFLVRDKNLDAKFVLRFVTIGVARLTGGLPIETVASLLCQQNHPHISTVYDWRTDLSKNCLVLDPPAERNLQTIIQNEGFLDLPRALDIFIQVCEALEDLHKVSVVHGHLRPRSIGIVESENKIDTVKVTNFSIANLVANNVEQPLKISRNYTCNDVFYMSPEELRDEVPSIPADIYSLGCVMFHSITGKPVYRARTVQEVKTQHLDVSPAKFRRRYEIPPDVELVVLRMLEPEPAKRYKNVRSIRRDLERLRDSKPPLLEDRWKTIFAFFGQ